MGQAAYMKFMLTIIAIYCTLMFTVEAFQFLNFRLLILRILASTTYTFILLYAFDCLTLRNREA